MIAETVVFIGHRKCPELKRDALRNAIEALINCGYVCFLSGGMGEFDRACARCVSELKRKYPAVRCDLVVPYRSFRIDNIDLYDEIVYPEMLTGCPYKAAIPKRNKYLVDHSSVALCYVNDTWGGAAKTYMYAIKKGLRVENLGRI